MTTSEMSPVKDESMEIDQIGNLKAKRDVDLDEISDLSEDLDAVDVPINITDDQGVVKRILTKGSGEKPQNGDEVFVNYVGRLVPEDPQADKPVFDSNQSTENPFSFTLGKGMVIKGWDLGVITMRKGEKAVFTLKPDYAYGSAGAGAKIPPNSTLEFEVTLLSYKSVSDLTPDGKVKLKMIKVNDDSWKKPEDKYEVIVSYKGTLQDGTVFVTKENVHFEVGDKQAPVPLFFSNAIKRFHKNDVGVLSLSSEHAYGENGNADLGVPSNTNIKYEITLKDFYEVHFHEEGQIKRKVVQVGEGWETPSDGAKIVAKITGKLMPSGTEFLSISNSQEMELGVGELPEALEIALLHAKKNEVMEITSPLDFGYGKSKANLIPSITDQTHFLFTVTLDSFQNKPDSWKMTLEGKFTDAENSRISGNKFFQDSQLRLAIKKYEKAIKYFESETKLEGENNKKANTIKLACHSNLSACFLKLGNSEKVIEHTKKALEIDSKHVKSLYRRAQARFQRQEYEEAERDLLKAIEIDQNEATLKVLLRQVKEQMKKQDQKDKKVFQNMFKAL